MHNHDHQNSDEGNGTPFPSMSAWMWPVLGSVAIGFITVMLLKNPVIIEWLETKSAVPAPAPAKPVEQAVAKMKPPPVVKKKLVVEKKPVVEKTPVVEKKPAAEKKPAPKKTVKIPSLDKKDIARLRIEISRLGDAVSDVALILEKQHRRLSSLEQVVGPITGSVPESTKKPGSTKLVKNSAKKLLARSVTSDKGDMLVKPVPEKKLNSRLVEYKTTKLPETHQDTVSAAPAQKDKEFAALTTKTPKVKPATANQFAIKIARAHKVSHLNAAWIVLRHRSGKEMKELSPRIRPVKDKEGKQAYDLVAGPFSDIAEAIEMCTRLKMKKIPCKQTDFTGEPLK